MARKSKASSTDDDSLLDFDFGGLLGEGGEAPAARVYTVEELDRRERREAHQAAAAAAADSGFVTEVVGEPAVVAQVAALGRRRLALFSRDRQARDVLFSEFAADIEGGPVEFLPAEAVLESERLLEELHRAVCRREGWGEDTPVEEVIGRLQPRDDPVGQSPQAHLPLAG